jgi:hypothetical protein
MLVDTNQVPQHPPYLIGGIQYAANIETIMTDTELSALGLTRFVPPPPPVPVAPVLKTPTGPGGLSRKQFFQQLAVASVITQDEAIGAMTGTIPPELAALITTAIPTDQQFAASMLISGMPAFERTNSVIVAIGAGLKWTPDALDAFWTAAGKL